MINLREKYPEEVNRLLEGLRRLDDCLVEYEIHLTEEELEAIDDFYKLVHEEDNVTIGEPQCGMA